MNVSMHGKWKLAAILVALAVVTAGSMAPLPGQDDPAADERPIVAARGATIDGQSVGEVTVNGQVALRIRLPAGGFGPGERAEVAARRLDRAIGQGATYEDIITGRRNGEWAVLAGDELIVTADSAHARMNNSTPAQLAQLWRTNLVNALVGSPVSPPPSEEPKPGEVDWYETGKKIVPIIDVGNRGVNIGAAQVVGPREQVDQTKAVAQIELDVRHNLRAKAYIPVSSLDIAKLDRVQGVSVWLVGDLRILKL